jgi:hypothetical protein
LRAFSTVFQLIDKIEAGDRASIIFFLKARLGWRENDPSVVRAGNPYLARYLEAFRSMIVW